MIWAGEIYIIQTVKVNVADLCSVEVSLFPEAFLVCRIHEKAENIE